MKTTVKKVSIFITLIIAIALTSCEDFNEEFTEELTIQQKVALLESGEWLLKGFEDRVMYTFENGERFTFYGTDTVFVDKAIPGTEDYSISGDFLILDLNFGNIKTYELQFSCHHNIAELYENGELHTTMYKRGSNYEQCL